MGMPAPAAPTYWTAAMVRELPDDGNRYECIDGELLVTPSPRNIHQAVVGELYLRLTPSVSAGRIHGPDLHLVIEVLSPSTASRDRGLKRRFYERIGVQEYWIVHPASRLVECWRTGEAAPRWEDGVLRWHPEGARDSLVIDLPALFDSIPEQFRTP